MSESIRVSLPGYDVLTDTNLDHYALYADQDNVLIKEFARGTISLASEANQNITHNLGYIPFFLVYVNDTTISANAWVLVPIPVITGPYFAAATTTVVSITNNTPSTTFTFKYFIFYDQQV